MKLPRRSDARHGTLPTGPGVWWFGSARLLDSVGTGFFYSGALLFFQQTSQLSLGTVGSCLAAAALVVLPLMFVIGRLVDRFGPKKWLIASALLRALVFVGYVWCHGMAAFVLLSIGAAIGNRTEQAATPVLCQELAGEGEVSRWVSLNRLLSNVGLGAGAALNSLLMATPHHSMTVVGLANAASFLGSALLVLPLRPRAVEAIQRPKSSVKPWQDPAFRRAAAANAMIWITAVALESALPLFLIEVLHLPGWSAGLMFTMNTALLMTLQLPTGRYLDRFAPEVGLGAGALGCAAACAVLQSTYAFPGGFRLPVVAFAIVVWTLGEMVAFQSGTLLLLSIPPEQSRGSYMAFNQIPVGIAVALAPLLAAGVLQTDPQLLWWGVGGAAVTSALLVGPSAWGTLRRVEVKET